MADTDILIDMAEGQTYEQGLVSIVTPVYKAERFIEQTILSVQAQTYRQWELLLVDDCSPDQSSAIIGRLAKDDHRIRHIQLTKNGGAAVARNEGISLARGEFLAFLDADDYWMSDKLERQLQFMAKMKADFVFASIQPVDENGQVLKAPTFVPTEVDYHYLLSHTVIATSTVLLRRSAVGSFRMPLRRGGQDYATWLMLLRKVKHAYGQQECLTKYRVTSGSLSSNKLSSVKQVYTIQTQQEGIGPLQALCNTLGFCLYAFKKHYL